VIEHVAVCRPCDGRGQITARSFPRGVGAPVQYGPGIRALGAYLHVFQHLPYEYDVVEGVRSGLSECLCLHAVFEEDRDGDP
jgi:hypothetical protein